MTKEQIKAIADSFKIRSSATLDICAGTIGLTEKQAEALAIHVKRNTDFANGVERVKPLTDKMVAELKQLTHKRDNPELPDGAKTYCKKWLNEYLFHRRKDVKSKYIDKGNIHEEDGFTAMCLELNLGMVYKNTQYHSNDYMHGTDDLFVKGIVYDNKCSYELDTFPLWETEIPDDKYEWQLNSYEELRKVEDGFVVYTLIDADVDIVEREIKWLNNPNDIYKRICELVYTKEYFDTLIERFCPTAEFDYFVEIPQADRVKPFAVKKDSAKIATIKERVIMCRAYINELLTAKYLKK